MTTLICLALLVPLAQAQPAPVATAPAVTNGEHPDHVDFDFKWKVGQTSRHRIVSRTVGAVTLPPPWPEQRMSQTIEEDLITRCVKVNEDGSGEFEMTIDGINLKMSIGALTITYDSRTYDPQAQTNWVTRFVSKIFDAMNGASFKTTISPTGRALKVEGLGQTLKKMAASLGEDAHEAVARSMLDQMSSMFDESAMAQEIQSLYRILPGKSGRYRVGDKWEHTWSFKLPILNLRMKGLGEYELVGFETVAGRPCVKIVTRETVAVDSIDPANPAAPGAGNAAIMDALRNLDLQVATSDGEGYALVDYRTGEIVQVRGTQGMTMTMNLRPRGAGAKPDGGDAQADAGGDTGTQFRQRFRVSLRADLVEPGEEGNRADPAEPGAQGAANQSAGTSAPEQ